MHIPHGIHLFYGPGSKNIVHITIVCVCVCLNSSLNLHLQLDEFVNKFEIEGPGVEQDMDKGQKLMEVYAVEFDKVESTRLEMGETFSSDILIFVAHFLFLKLIIIIIIIIILSHATKKNIP